MNQQGLNEALALYQASVRRSPALMMETVNVDSNRGVTSRGNSPYDKYASPETRAKVLESRMQEIAAFAQSRSIPASNLYALAEAAMRTGKIPDMGQFGLAGDDAVATKQFLISNVLNIAGLEWTDYKGDPVEEEDTPKRPTEHGRSGFHLVDTRTGKVASGSFHQSSHADDARELHPDKKHLQVMDARYLNPSAFGQKNYEDVGNVAEAWGKETEVDPREEGKYEGRSLASLKADYEKLKVGGPYKEGSDNFDKMKELAFAIRAKTGWGKVEEDESEREAEKQEREARRRKLAARRRSQRTTGGQELAMDSDTFDPSRYMAEGTEGMRKGTQAHTGEWGGSLGGRPGSGRIDKVQLKVGKTKRRRAGRGEAEAGMAEYEAEKEERQEDDVNFDPMLYVAEGSTKAGGYPFGKKEAHYRGHSDAELAYAHRDAVAAARSMQDHDPHAENWYRDDAATIQKEMNRRRKGGSVTSSIDVDPSRYMAEGHQWDYLCDGCGTRHSERAFARAHRSGECPTCGESAINIDAVPKLPKKPTTRPAAPTPLSGPKRQEDSVEFDPSRYMAEEGGPYRTGGAPQQAPLTPSRMSDGGTSPTKPQNYENHDLLSKEVMAKLRKEVGDGVYGYTRAELFALARSRGLLGTEESLGNGNLQEHDYLTSAKKHGGKFVKYIQGNIGIYEFPSPGAAQQFAEDCSAKTTATPKVDGRTVFIDEPTMGESQEPPRGRSESDKILGIMDGDPRGETWPKLGDEMARLLNLEDCGVFRGPRGFHMEESAPVQIQEMTISAGMGGFIGAGMLGGGMTGRTCAMPSYDASYELPDDPEERIKMLKKMLDKHGLKKPVEESVDEVEERYEPAPNSTEVPVVRSTDYDNHPSRFMKRR